MKSAGPAGLSLVQRKARVVERWLIQKIGDPVGSSAPDQRRNRVNHQSKAIFGLLDFVKGFLQRLLCSVLFGDIYMRAN